MASVEGAQAMSGYFIIYGNYDGYSVEGPIQEAELLGGLITRHKMTYAGSGLPEEGQWSLIRGELLPFHAAEKLMDAAVKPLNATTEWP